MTTRDSFTGLSNAQLQARWDDTVRDLNILYRRRERIKNNLRMLQQAGYEVVFDELLDCNVQINRVSELQTMYEDRLVENQAKGWTST
jgi:hypothetical protein